MTNRSKTKGTKPCKIWTGSTINGYGNLGVEGKTWLVHRYAYTQAYGPIPPDQDVHHLCDEKLCYEPEHLFACTSREHHEMHYGMVCSKCGASEWRRKKDGRRVCVPCHKAYMNKYNRTPSIGWRRTR